LEAANVAIFKNYIEQVTFDQVWALMGQDKEEMAQYQEAYQSIFEELKAASPKENTEHMTIRFVLEEEPEWSFYFDTQEDDETESQEAEEDPGPTLQVYGFVPGDEEGYAIGLKPPEVLVGLEVDPETAEAYSPAEIVAHCIAEMTYTSTVAASAYGTDKDMAGGGLLASQACMSEDIQNVDLEKLRQELGVLPKPEEDYKEKYGFLF
jgi:hypothetical protein